MREVAEQGNKDKQDFSDQMKSNRTFATAFLNFLEKQPAAENIKAEEDYVPLPPEQPADSSSAQE